MPEVRPTHQGDLPKVLRLLQAAQLPTEGVESQFDRFVVAVDDGQTVGCAGLEVYGDAGLLRSLAVHPDYQSSGLGKQLTEAIISEAKAHRLSSLCLLTTTASHYFPRFGFTECSRNQLPASLWDSEEFRGACPDSATAMMLGL